MPKDITNKAANKSGQQKAQDAVKALKAYLQTLSEKPDAVPLHRGTLNIKAVCKALGVARSTANQNPAFRSVLDTWCEHHNIPLHGDNPPTLSSEKPVPSSAPDADSQRIIKRLEKDLKAEQQRANTLEKRLAHLLAQNTHLHMRLRQQEARERFLTEKGKGGRRS